MTGRWSWPSGALLLLLCALLLLRGEVTCQDDADAPDAGDAGGASTTASTAGPGAADVSTAPTGGAGGGTAGGPADTAAPGAPGFAFSTFLPLVPKVEDAAGGDVGAVSPADDPSDSGSVTLVTPSVTCVGKEDIPQNKGVKAVVTTDTCADTKRILEETPAGWCQGAQCNLEVFQDGNDLLVSSGDAALGTLAQALLSDSLKDKLGVTKAEAPPSSGSSVLAGILVTGLLAAIAITLGYFRCQRKADPKGAKLAEEAYPVDQDTQGNTLASAAPLNPPAETQEKPSANGESPEADKAEPAPPPTNGHSTAKTADTQL